MKTIFIFPTEEEAAPFRERRPDAQVIICGVGQARAAAAAARAIASERPGRVVLAGLAGAYGDDPAVGSVCVVEAERESGLPERFAAEFRAGSLPGRLPRVVSNTVAVSGAEARGAHIENMEGAAVMALCEAMGVEFCEVRAISNRVGQPFYEWRTKEAAANLAEILIKTYYNKYVEFMKSSTKWILIAAAIVVVVLLVMLFSSNITKWTSDLGVKLIGWILFFVLGFVVGYGKGYGRAKRKALEKAQEPPKQ